MGQGAFEARTVRETSMAETRKPTIKAKATKSKKATHKEQEERLDNELADTFPASDPLSLTQPTTEVGCPDRKPRKAKRQESPHRAVSI